jgi:hypothetical protein
MKEKSQQIPDEPGGNQIRKRDSDRSETDNAELKENCRCFIRKTTIGSMALGRIATGSS